MVILFTLKKASWLSRRNLTAFEKGYVYGKNLLKKLNLLRSSGFAFAPVTVLTALVDLEASIF